MGFSVFILIVKRTKSFIKLFFLSYAIYGFLFNLIMSVHMGLHLFAFKGVRMIMLKVCNRAR